MRTRGHIVWFIGLSGAGKTTLSSSLGQMLEEVGHVVTVLDGDLLRKGLCSDLGFSDEDRVENVRRTAHVANLFANNGTTVLIATISPLPIQRKMAKSILPDMFEIFVDAPLVICEARDPKGLYQQARSGRLPGFTGIDAPFVPPESPDLVCRTDSETLKESLTKVWRNLFPNTSLPASLI